ncbi:MAG: TolC family protein [Chlorobi bacterium]|nr:TolC family protein [Chlorobiota bacterium]
MARHTYRKSYWGYRTFKATYLPGLQVQATLPNINRTINAIAAQDGSTVYTPQSLANYSVNMTLSQKVGFTGGEVFLTSGLQRLDNYFTDTTMRQYLSSVISIGFRQPIFAYNPYKWDKKIEPMKFREAQRIYIETREDVAIKAVDRFFSLLLAQIEVEIARTNEANYDTLFRIAKGRFNLGKIAENELLQLELNLLQSRSAVEDARLNYDNMVFEFKSFLRLKNDYPVELIPPENIDYFSVDVQKAIEQARENTSTGLQFQRRLLEAQSEVNRAKMDGRFDAQLFASFGLTQTSTDISLVYKNPLDEERVTLGITLPLLDWGKARGNIKMAESNQDLVKTTVEQEKIDFQQNIFLVVTRFNMQKRQLIIAAKSDTVARKRYEVTQKRYMIGMVNDVLELNMAQIDTDNARMGYIRALMDYWKSYYQVRKLTLYDFEHDQPITATFDDLIN